MIILIKAVLFDLDGTLIDTNNLIIQSFKYTLNKHLGKCPDDKEITSHFGEPLIKTMENYDNEKSDLLFKTYLEYNAKVHDELIRGFKGVNEALENLKNNNIKLAVVTSKRKELAVRELKMFNLYDYFNTVVALEDTDRKKPFGDPAIKACELLDVYPQESMMIGDSHFDILCGRNGGCKTCLVKYTVMDLNSVMTYEPDYIVDDLGEIFNIIVNNDMVSAN